MNVTMIGCVIVLVLFVALFGLAVCDGIEERQQIAARCNAVGGHVLVRGMYGEVRLCVKDGRIMDSK